ncbi:uncharacterized protein LOC115979433 isoform X3 [Quercus lobata]|uniref:uncharacterized protein LOC115979433 isoform X3 n=1 Tax=Quercus lobata TaxID=97700 RepID=UPI00124550A9|nr:uncharacterized protein LOC115979433 isoform X3 [Quercus lobata]
MAELSKVLNTPGAEKQTKRELFDALRQELEKIKRKLQQCMAIVWRFLIQSRPGSYMRQRHVLSHIHGTCSQFVCLTGSVIWRFFRRCLDHQEVLGKECRKLSSGSKVNGQSVHPVPNNIQRSGVSAVQGHTKAVSPTALPQIFKNSVCFPTS